MFLANNQDGQVNFQIGMVGFSIGQGKILTYQHVGPDELKSLMEQSGRGRKPASPVVLDQIDGLARASSSGAFPSNPGSSFKITFVNRPGSKSKPILF